MARYNWYAVAGSAGIATAVEGVFGFGLSFNPGWASL